MYPSKRKLKIRVPHARTSNTFLNPIHLFKRLISEGVIKSLSPNCVIIIELTVWETLKLCNGYFYIPPSTASIKVSAFDTPKQKPLIAKPDISSFYELGRFNKIDGPVSARPTTRAKLLIKIIFLILNFGGIIIHNEDPIKLVSRKTENARLTYNALKLKSRLRRIAKIGSNPLKSISKSVVLERAKQVLFTLRIFLIPINYI